MIRQLLGLLALVVSGAGADGSGSSPAGFSVLTAATDTVHVAPPIGDNATDRANIQAAFDAVQPGGTVLFSPGTYLLGAGQRREIERELLASR